MKEHLDYKECIAICIRKAIRLAVHILWIFPIKKNRIMFQSHDKGQGYNCSPKYICEYLKKTYPDKYEYIWAFSEPDKFRNIPGIIPVRLYSIKWLYYCMTSHIIVSNVALPVFIPKRNKQFMVETWHGHAYKKLGLSVSGVSKRRKWSRRIAAESIDLFLNSSEDFKRTVIDDSFRYKGEVLDCGMPRNDILLNQELREAAAKEVRREFELAEYVVLFAPTFRKDGKGESCKNLMPYEDVIKALKERTGKSVSFLVRSHHWDRGMEIKGANIIDVSDYPDIQELYCASDMLITDYSSCMWDFALLSRPCLLYVPDWEQYKNEDRGFYFPLEDWPGIICHNKEEMIEAIKTLDEDKCAQIAKKHLDNSGSCESGLATEQVCERIVQYIDN